MFALGAAKRGIFLPDVQANRGYTNLPTGSDVLSVHQLEVCCLCSLCNLLTFL